MTYRSLLSGALMLALTLMTTTAQAQGMGGTSSSSSSTSTASSTQADEANALSSGTSSLAFTVPAGGNPYANGTAGYWYMLTDSINLGINLGLGIESTKTIQNFDTDNEESTQTTGFDLLLAPAIRYYLMNESSVAPYILGQINFHKFFDGDNDTSADPTEENFNSELQPELALVGGFGLEWFPVERFSIGGHIGLGIDILRQNQLNGTTLTKNGLRVGTFTSALTANLYF